MVISDFDDSPQDEAWRNWRAFDELIGPLLGVASIPLFIQTDTR